MQHAQAIIIRLPSSQGRAPKRLSEELEDSCGGAGADSMGCPAVRLVSSPVLCSLVSRQSAAARLGPSSQWATLSPIFVAETHMGDTTIKNRPSSRLHTGIFKSSYYEQTAGSASAMHPAADEHMYDVASVPHSEPC